MWPFDRIASEWPILKPMIAAAPWSVALLILAALAVGFGVASFLARRERNAMAAEKRLADAINAQLKDEAERISKELTALQKTPEPPAVAEVRHAGPQIVQALYEIEEKKTIRFYGAPSQWGETEINKFAQFTRLRDMGAVRFEQHTIPQHTTVTSTSTSAEIVAILKLDDLPFKK